MKLYSTCVLLCLLASTIAIDISTDDFAKDEHKDVGDITVDNDNGNGSKLKAQNVDAVQEMEKHDSEDFPIASKDIPIEHDENEEENEHDQDEKAFEEKKNIGEDAIENAEIIIDPKDVEKLKDPEMQRLARQLSGFHGRQVFRINAALHNALEQQEKASMQRKVEVVGDYDVLPEERAIRRRTRIRRRNSNNRLKSGQSGRDSTVRRRNTRRKSPNKNALRRSNKIRNGVKRRKNTRNKRTKNGVRRGGNRKNVKFNKNGKRRFNKRNGQNNRNMQLRRRNNRKNMKKRNQMKKNRNKDGNNAMRPGDKPQTASENGVNEDNAQQAAAQLAF